MRSLVAVVTLVGAMSVAGCGGGGGSEPPPTPAPTEDVWSDGIKPAAASAPVDCPLPVRFDLAAAAHAERGDTQDRDGLDEACVISGGKATLRVFVGEQATPRSAVDRFLGGEGPVRDPRYRDTKAGKSDAVEVTYVNAKGLRGRAFAMATTLRTVVVAISGGPYEAAVPEYLLAKDSLIPVER